MYESTKAAGSCKCDEDSTCLDKALQPFTQSEIAVAYERMKEKNGWDKGWTAEEFVAFVNARMREQGLSLGGNRLVDDLLAALGDEEGQQQQSSGITPNAARIR